VGVPAHRADHVPGGHCAPLRLYTDIHAEEGRDHPNPGQVRVSKVQRGTF